MEVRGFRLRGACGATSFAGDEIRTERFFLLRRGMNAVLASAERENEHFLGTTAGSSAREPFGVRIAGGGRFLKVAAILCAVLLKAT